MREEETKGETRQRTRKKREKGEKREHRTPGGDINIFLVDEMEGCWL